MSGRWGEGLEAPRWSWWGWLRDPARRSFSLRSGTWKRRNSSDDELMHLVDDAAGSAECRDLEGQLPATAERQDPRAQRIKIAFIVAAIVVLVLLLTGGLPVKRYLLDTSGWIQAHRFWGTFVAILLFWVAIPLCIPATILEAVSGSLFGVSQGVVVILIGKTGGSWLTFLLARSFGKATIGDYLSRRFPTFRALSDVLNGPSWKPLVLFQLSSVPNIVKCYGLAITDISSSRFILSFIVGSLPHSIIWASIGHQASDIAAILSGSTTLSSEKLVLVIGGGVLTAVAMAALIIYTKRELQELQKRECASGGEEEPTPIIMDVLEPGLALHSEANDLVKVRSNTHG